MPGLGQEGLNPGEPPHLPWPLLTLHLHFIEVLGKVSFLNP